MDQLYPPQRQLTEIADTAQRAGWTPAVLADARERYLPGLSDEQIIAWLDALIDRLGGLVLGYLPSLWPGRVVGRWSRPVGVLAPSM